MKRSYRDLVNNKLNEPSKKVNTKNDHYESTYDDSRITNDIDDPLTLQQSTEEGTTNGGSELTNSENGEEYDINDFSIKSSEEENENLETNSSDLEKELVTEKKIKRDAFTVQENDSFDINKISHSSIVTSVDQIQILPDNIKNYIEERVGELKKILSSDPEFLMQLNRIISNIASEGVAHSMSSFVISHYSDLIQECTQKNTPLPEHVIKTPGIVESLSYLVCGESQLIYEYLGTIGDSPNEYYIKCRLLGDLARTAISHKFDPDTNYYVDKELLGISSFYENNINYDDF